MTKKYMLLPVLAGGLLLSTPGEGRALTAYAVGESEDAYFAIDPSTIQDGESGHRTADVYAVRIGYEGNIAKEEFNCAERRAQTLSEKSYEAEDDGMNFLSDEGSTEIIDVPKDTILEDIFTFVCGWPQVSSSAVQLPDAPNLQKLFTLLSNRLMMDRSDSKQNK